MKFVCFLLFFHAIIIKVTADFGKDKNANG